MPFEILCSIVRRYTHKGEMEKMVNIAIMGFGVVGSGVAETITLNAKAFAERTEGLELNVKYILDLRDFPEHPLGDRVVHDITPILEDDEVSIVVETMGGTVPAYDFSKKALLSGKSVVTSNKEVVAKHGAELQAIAREKGVSYLFEASVGGGIPIIRPMWQCLASNKIKSVTGILNGTCNYILTKMERDKEDFETALKQAQELGYAEKNPAADVEGMDTCRKISILASLAYGKTVSTEDISCEGITKITYEDLVFARNNGYSIKLLGRASKEDDGKVYVITAPFLVPETNALAGVNDVYNGISVVGNIVGDVLFCGRGAGSLPTASAVMADVLDVVRDCKKSIGWKDEKADFLGNMAGNVTANYIRTKASKQDVLSAFGKVEVTEMDGNCMFIVPEMSEMDLAVKIKSLELDTVRIRVMK